MRGILPVFSDATHAHAQTGAAAALLGLRPAVRRGRELAEPLRCQAPRAGTWAPGFRAGWRGCGERGAPAGVHAA